MIDWSKGISAETYITEVDPITWKDVDRIEITSGTISRTNEGLRNAADIECLDYDQTKERWVRIYLDARQGDSSEHTPLFTGIASSPNRDIYGSVNTNKIQCDSVLKPCQDVLLPRGWYAPANTNAVSIIKELLKATPAPVEEDEDSPNLYDHIVAEDGETRLTMIDKILLAIGWRMQITGNGTIQLRNVAKKSLVTFDPISNDVIENDLSVEYDWYSAPNVFRAISDSKTYTAVDDSEDSPLSTVNRGREIWVEETDCHLNDGESLESYAKRRLKEEQRVNYAVSYKRRYRPDIYASDIVSLHYPAQRIQGDFFITSQKIELGYCATTSEEVVGI